MRHGWNYLGGGVRVWSSGGSPTRVESTGTRDPREIENKIAEHWGHAVYLSMPHVVDGTYQADVSRDPLAHRPPLKRESIMARLENPIGGGTIAIGLVALLGVSYLVFKKPNAAEAKQAPPALPPAKQCVIDTAQLHVFAMGKQLFGRYLPDWKGYPVASAGLMPPNWPDYVKLVPSDSKAPDGTPVWTSPLVVLSDGSFWTYDTATTPPTPSKRDDLRAAYCSQFAGAAPATAPPPVVKGLPRPWSLT